MKKCAYCGKEKEDKELVPLGTHFQVNDFDGLVNHRWICAPEMGCQKSDKGSWGLYFLGTLFYDIPFFIFGALIISALHFILFPMIEQTLPLDAWKWEAALCGIFVVTPVFFSLSLGIPIFISPVLLTIFSIFIIL